MQELKKCQLDRVTVKYGETVNIGDNQFRRYDCQITSIIPVEVAPQTWLHTLWGQARAGVKSQINYDKRIIDLQHINPTISADELSQKLQTIKDDQTIFEHDCKRLATIYGVEIEKRRKHEEWHRRKEEKREVRQHAIKIIIQYANDLLASNKPVNPNLTLNDLSSSSPKPIRIAIKAMGFNELHPSLKKMNIEQLAKSNVQHILDDIENFF